MQDDRARVEAKPEDVGDQALIRGFKPQFRDSSGAVRCLRAGVDRLIGHKAISGIPLPWLRPRRCTIFVRVAVRMVAPYQACRCACAADGAGVPAARLTAQMKPDSSRAIAVTTRVGRLPRRANAR